MKGMEHDIFIVILFLIAAILIMLFFAGFIKVDLTKFSPL
jgi:hypothetical protein